MRKKLGWERLSIAVPGTRLGDSVILPLGWSVCTSGCCSLQSETRMTLWGRAQFCFFHDLTLSLEGRTCYQLVLRCVSVLSRPCRAWGLRLMCWLALWISPSSMPAP